MIGSFEAVLRRASGSVNFELVLQPGLPQAMIDATQFETALLNLVVNARDATPDTGSITLSTEAVRLGSMEVNSLSPGLYVRVAVKDTGAGMPPDVVARAAEPFFTTKDIGKGTGMGLSQVYGFVQQAGGEILKFIGDGMLAIFPLEEDGACVRALEAAHQARRAMAARSARPCG